MISVPPEMFMIGQPRTADALEEPAVRTFVPRLAGRSQQPQRAEIESLRAGARLAHQQPYGGGRNAEGGDPMPLDHLPEPVGPMG